MEYVTDNPLLAEPDHEHNEAENLVSNMEGLLGEVMAGTRTHAEAAALVAVYDQECELPIATTAMLGLTYGRNRADVVSDVARFWDSDTDS